MSEWAPWALPLATFAALLACALVEGEHRRSQPGRQLQADSFPDDWVPELKAAGDHSWTIARTIGILTMQGGFALLEAGSVRPANKANIMMKNVADMSVGLLAYAAYGYSLTFAPFHPFIGGTSRLLLIGAESEYTHVLHQFSFAATTGTIVSGALAERVSFKAYVVLASLWVSSVLYSVAAHWVWTEEGWLAQIRFVDFAGAGCAATDRSDDLVTALCAHTLPLCPFTPCHTAMPPANRLAWCHAFAWCRRPLSPRLTIEPHHCSVVHLLGGACALVATSLVGPRTGRFGALPPLLLRWQRLRSRLCDELVARLPPSLACALSPRRTQRSSLGIVSTTDLAARGPAAAAPVRTLRREQIARVREAEEFRVSDPVNVIYGTFILYVGWISFNCSGT